MSTKIQKVDLALDVSSNIVVGLEVLNFVELLGKILKNKIKNNTGITLSEDVVLIVLKLLKTAPSYFNNVEKTFVKIVKDNKLDASELPNVIVLVQELYELIYKNKDTKLDSKKRGDVCASILKFLLHTLVEERIIKINEHQKTLFLSNTDKLIDSLIGLVKLPKELKNIKMCTKRFW
jgi:hypothetical protein